MFEIDTDKEYNYYFILKAKNGAVLMSSEKFTSKFACLNCIDSVRKNAFDAKINDKTI